MRIRLKALFTGTLWLLSYVSAPAVADPHNLAAANACATAATDFLASLDGSQRPLAGQAFDEARRRIWSYGPNVAPFTLRAEGVALRDMSDLQRRRAHQLLNCGLSSQGYQKSTSIMWLDDILAQSDLYRDMENLPFGSTHYWLAVFGVPGGPEPWGWQYEGHHLALNFTVVDNEIIYAPAFMGADPAIVPDGDQAGWRILGDEVDKALQLVQALDTKQLKKALLSAELPAGAYTGRPGQGDALKTFAGLPVAELNPEQQWMFWGLVETYVGNANNATAQTHLAAIRADGDENIYFAWMGATEADQGIYYRIHSPSVLIEFATARDRQSPTLAPNPNHVHTIFRYPGNDFGADLLQRHYATSPHHQEP